MALILSTAQPARHPDPTVKAQALAFLMFDRPDLDLAERFLVDFGLVRAARTSDALFMRAAEPSAFCYVAFKADKARFRGLGLSVGTRADLERLAALPGASHVEPAPCPGGGERVRLEDPSGFEVHAVHGASPVPPLERRAALVWNVGGDHARVDAPQRPRHSPPQVLKLGHVVLELADYQRTAGWYTRHFGFIPSDVQLLPDGAPAVAFMRLDLGSTPADHHTLALAQGLVDTYSHSAYEVVDADAVGMGQQVLKERGWRHAWGIGRHLLGSQVFDYWQDPYGDKHEHYTDGDVFTADRPTGFHPLSRQGMAQWGEEMPKSFVKPKPSLPLALSALKNILGGAVPIGRIRKLAQALF
jgi:Glyoxalase/Bleomycin resistance protein/Dioxygenase superfamily